MAGPDSSHYSVEGESARKSRLSDGSTDSRSTLRTDRRHFRSRRESGTGRKCLRLAPRAPDDSLSVIVSPPMGMTIAEKILAKKSGLPSVVPDQIVDAYPD